MMPMRVFILAGGEGKRLRSVIGEIPKPMARVAGKPFLEHLIALLKNNGLTDIVVGIGYKKDLIVDYLGDGRAFGVCIEYVVEEEPLGTGGAVKHAMETTDLGEEFFVLNGDCYFALDHGDMLNAHKRLGGVATIALSSQTNIERFGSVEVGEDLRILQFREKAAASQSGLINGGVYVFSRGIARHFPPRQSFSLEYDVFPHALRDRLYGFVSNEYFIDIGVPEDLQRAQTDFLQLCNI